MSSEGLKLRLKLSTGTKGDETAQVEARVQVPEPTELLIGARGGAALKDLLSTAPNPEVAIHDFQVAHGMTGALKATNMNRSKRPQTSFNPAVQLLDLLALQRSSLYHSLLEKLLAEMLLRIEELPQEELQRVLEATFPYIEFRELRAIPIAILARQEETPEMYLRELTENRKLVNELPVHVRRKIMHVDKQELHIFVEQCTQEYIQERVAWYLKHPGQTAKLNGRDANSHEAEESGDLWNVTSHVPMGASSSSSSSTSTRQSRWTQSPEERRRQNPTLAKLTEMLGDSESLYLSTLEILKDYVVAANIPGSTNTNPKEYVDYVPFLGALRCDLANTQRDKTTSLLRTDPLHKFIWFLDRALKNQTLDIGQLHELLGFIGKLRTGDLPPNKRFKKKAGVDGAPGAEIQEEEENFEIVLGPPPVDELLTVLDKLSKLDVHMIFAEPVPDDVPKYREVIKEPMDLSTMRKKAKRGKYKTLESFVDDFNLMIRNCMTFNPDTTIFYKEGKRLGKRGNELIEKNAMALRGEPQRIRAKKRRKSGPSEAISMLTSTGVVMLKDFGDVDQSGMVPEGMCEEMLADVAMILSDPHVKHLLCDTLMKNLIVCWQKKELPTDNLVCRALVQLLQIGNPSSVRRMIRKKDFVLRAPQVVTMRVVLPLLLRSMATFRIYFPFPPSLHRELKAKEDVVDAMLWENVLRASSAIRAITKAFAVQCLVDHQIEAGVSLLQCLLATEDDLLLRDRVFLHALGEVILEQVQSMINANSHSNNTGENGASATSVSDRLKASSMWKLVVEGFFLDTLEQRTRSAKKTRGTVLVYYDTENVTEGRTAQMEMKMSVKTFPVPIFHEKTAMVLHSVLQLLETVDPSIGEPSIVPSLKRTLGVLRHCCTTLGEFQSLWASSVFHSCRELYEPLLLKCPEFRQELFTDAAAEGDKNANAEIKVSVKDETKAEAHEQPNEIGTKISNDSIATEAVKTEVTEIGNPKIETTVTDGMKPVAVEVEAIKTETGEAESMKIEAVETAEGTETKVIKPNTSEAATVNRDATVTSDGMKSEDVEAEAMETMAVKYEAILDKATAAETMETEAMETDTVKTE